MSEPIKGSSKPQLQPTAEIKEAYGIKVRASEVVDNKDGTYHICVEARQMTSQEKEIMRKLFPNMIEKAYDLLTKEALFAAMVD